ncbi:MAG: hypothetical protein BGO51_15345 [Rhodospirillales bacterium 69-11]|nr:type II toxin-antitoxin system VapB family antitoxin [Rhodospirillales bacterium]MBN8928105.1 type II toxin-antitoxin system VapB family antitoxin [Rhodospirillales bacterium]OJW22128.1 MAG: hypothetical protein BGO51_15345 [Rhodospirillales bacterium 69-11]
MGAQLNIKSDEAFELASRLSARTGESRTALITRLLREELDRQEGERRVEADMARMLAYGAEIRRHLHTPTSSDMSDLYDEQGLPR